MTSAWVENPLRVPLIYSGLLELIIEGSKTGIGTCCIRKRRKTL